MSDQNTPTTTTTPVPATPPTMPATSTTPATPAITTPAPPAPPTTPATEPASDANAEPTNGTEPSWLHDRLDRARRIERENLLKQLGFESADQLETAVADYRKRLDADLTETERLQKELETEREQRAALQKQVEEQARETVEAKRRETIASAASEALVPADVVAYARDYLPELYAQVLNEGGEVNADTVKAIIDKCNDDRRHWFAKPPTGGGSPSNANRAARAPGSVVPTTQDVDRYSRSRW